VSGIRTFCEEVVVITSTIEHNVMMEKDDSKEETAIFKAQKKRQVIVRVQNYAEIVVPSMSDETFRDILG